MATKKISDLALRSDFDETCILPVDDATQTWRVTGEQLRDFLIAGNMITDQTDETSPVVADSIIMSDASAAGALKEVTLENLIKLINPPGKIEMHGGTSAPTGYLLCDGSAVSRSTYAALFAAVSTGYGVGDGSTTFNVPDFRNVFPRGVNASTRAIGGVTYPAVVRGTTAADMMQGHYHDMTLYAGGVTNDGTYAPALAQETFGNGTGNNNGSNAMSAGFGGPRTDGTNGTPRIGVETAPVNLGVHFIIKT